MAHKHNRRRIRHRPRCCQYEQSLPTVYEVDNYHNLASWSEPELLPDFGRTSRASDASLDSHVVGAAHPQPWRNKFTICHERETSRGTNLLESKIIKEFGGEPGEGFALIDKMRQVFDSMDWVI